MKRSIFILGIGTLFLASCEEKPPVIHFTEAAVIMDTTYVGTVPTTEPHHVLIEEFTGQACSNCPGAHDLLAEFAAANPGQVHTTGLYNFGIQQTVPPGGSAYDLRDSIATDIGNTIYLAVGAIPSGGVDRVPVAGKILLNKGDWGATLNSRLLIDDSLNLGVTSVWDATKGEAIITATITYTKSVSGLHNLSIAITEDSMVDKQEFPLGVEEEHYVFTNVLRGMATAAPWGDPILPAMAVKEPGRVVIRSYKYKPKTLTPAINPAHCKVVAYVNSTGSANKEVMQSAETKLK
jgi:hypothetical protein